MKRKTKKSKKHTVNWLNLLLSGLMDLIVGLILLLIEHLS